MGNKIERTYTIPLRKEILKVPKVRRANKAIKAVNNFLIKHMKSTNIVIGKFLNEAIWTNGMKNPPGKVEVNVVKEDDKVFVELVGAPVAKVEGKKGAKKETKKATEKVSKKTEAKADAKSEKAEKVDAKKEEVKAEPKKTEAKEEAEAKDEKPKAETKKAPAKKAPTKEAASKKE